MSIALDRLVGSSAIMQRLRQQILTLARYDIPIHIQGESGVGKELVAQALHQGSARADRPFVPINCAAIPSTLLESEWFGHRAGSFSGAQRNHLGLFQQADSGTLFLDEVADLNLEAQAKLLRVLQERCVRAVGADQEQAVDVRIVSASHKVLSEGVATGHLRLDLYYRLEGVVIEVPPLRQRKEDLKHLVPHLLQEAQRRWRIPEIRFDPQVWPLLGSYPYPGNVRELEHCLMRAACVGVPPQITQETLQRSGFLSNKNGLFKENYATMGLSSSLHEHEKKYIQHALVHTDNRQQAAHVLGLSQRALRYRMKKLGLSHVNV